MKRKVNITFLFLAAIVLSSFILCPADENKSMYYLSESVLNNDIFGYISSTNEDLSLYYSFAENLKLNWESYETDHLKIIYPDYLYKFSVYISNIAEDVYKTLSEETGYHPDGKIVVLLSTRTDSLGYVMIGPKGLYVTLQAIFPYEAINYGLDSYREWYRTLISHEFAHIFHIGERRGFSKIASGVFGNAIYPNGLTPVFYREGFAVDFETKYNKNVGRANSCYTEMYLRTAFDENLVNGDIWIDRFSSRPRIWPFTTGCYLYGASFLKYLTLKYGEDILYKINYDSSNFYYTSWISAFKLETGENVSDLWSDWINFERNRQLASLENIKKEGFTSFKRISQYSGNVYSLSLSKSKRYAFYSLYNGEKASGLYRYDFQKKTNKLIKRNLVCSKIEFDEGSNGVFYIRKSYDRNNGWIKNLYYMNLNKSSEYELTETGHIADFAFFDRNHLLIVKSTEKGSKIYIAEFNRKSMKIDIKNEVVNLYKKYTVESPAFSPDRSKIAFSGKDSAGKRFIILAYIEKEKFDIEITKIELLKNIPGSSYFPKWINDRFLTFINDGNGVYNLYFADLLSKKYHRATNLSTGILGYDISNDGDVLGKIYSSDGFFVGRWSISGQSSDDFFSEGKFNIVEIKSPVKTRIKTYWEENSERVIKKSYYKPESYNPLNYLFPNYWVPVAAGNGINFGVGLFTLNRDYIGRFDYSFALVYDLVDSMFKLSLTGEINFSSFALFGSNLLYDYSNSSIGNYIKNMNLSCFYGIESQVVSYNYIVGGKFGILRDFSFSGVRFIMDYSNAKVDYKWDIAYRGLIARSDFYLELAAGNWLLNRSSIYLYFPGFANSAFKFGGEVLTDFGSGSGVVYIGYGLNYLYAPVNGIVSYGYPDVRKGDIALKESFTLNIPVFQVERGIGVVPFYLNSIYGSVGANLYEMLDLGQGIGGGGNCGSIFNLDKECLRLSLNFSINFNTTIFYDFASLIKIGYILAPLKGGINRIYISFVQR